MKKEKQKYILLLLIPVLGCIVFSNSITSFFVYDDIPLIVNNILIKDFKFFKDISNWINIHNRPISFFTLALNYKYSALEAESYHLMNVILHITGSLTACLLAFKLVLILPKNNFLKVNKLEFSLIIGLIFLIHPLQTQPVNYIIQRMTVLSAIGYMLGMVFYINTRLSMTKRINRVRVFLNFLMSIFFFGFGLLSKQNVASFPLMILFFEILFFGLSSKKQKKRIAVVIMILIFLTALLVVKSPVLTDSTTIPRMTYFITQLKVFLIYLNLFFLTIDLNLDHDILLISSLDLASLAHLFLLIMYFICAFFLKKKNILYSFGMIWVLVALSVESSIIPIRDVIAEHRMYLPLFGFAMVITILIFEIRKNIYRFIFSILLITTLSILSFNRNKDWNSSLSLWKDTQLKSPNKARPYLGVGVSYMNLKQYQNAQEAFQSALEIDSLSIDALNNLGQLNFINGNVENSISYYYKALSLVPNDPYILLNIGQAWEKIFAYKEALRYYKKSLKIRPGNPLVHYNIGNIFFAREEFYKAVKSYKKSISLGSYDKDIYFNLANSYYYLNDWNSAEINYQNALLIDSLNISVLLNLGNTYFQKMNYSKAKYYYQKVIKMDSTNNIAKQNIVLVDKSLRK